jgi:hypothetical protein
MYNHHHLPPHQPPHQQSNLPPHLPPHQPSHLPPHLQPHQPPHLPPHLRHSSIRLSYDDNVITYLGQLYEDVDYVIDIIESCPPEMKLTLAIALDIPVHIADRREYFHPHIRFETPFINRKNRNLIKSSILSSNPEAAADIYNNCPPEHALLALAIAAMKERGDEA